MKNDDSISRQEAIDTLHMDIDIIPFVKAKEYVREAIETVYNRLKDLPSTQPELHWIPCSERLPEYMETVLTWDGSCYCVEKRIPYICDDDGEHIEGDWWVSDDYDELNSGYYPNLRDGACIAWMPLPKPYEGEQDD